MKMTDRIRTMTPNPTEPDWTPATGPALDSARSRTPSQTDTPEPARAESNEAYAPRVKIQFGCTHEHEFTLTFAHDADLPTQWDCPRCGQTASRLDGTPAPVVQTKPPLSHWDRLLQRRSLPELEQLLADRLQEIRSTR
jgi:hypothetical protein